MKTVNPTPCTQQQFKCRLGLGPTDLNVGPRPNLLYFVLFLLTTTLAFAAPQTDFWQCTATDPSNQTWTAQHQYQQAAINQAFEQCKKLSHTPESCSISKSACDFFANGTNTTSLWQCTALDKMNKTWKSRLYRNRDDAAIAARAYCEQKSGMPDTCYVNLLTCKTTPETKG